MIFGRQAYDFQESEHVELKSIVVDDIKKVVIRDAIKPDLTMFLHYETLDIDGKQIIAVDIQRGTQRPYYIAKKGLRSEGVYVRQGYSSVPATKFILLSKIYIGLINCQKITEAHFILPMQPKHMSLHLYIVMTLKTVRYLEKISSPNSYNTGDCTARRDTPADTSPHPPLV